MCHPSAKQRHRPVHDAARDLCDHHHQCQANDSQRAPVVTVMILSQKYVRVGEMVDGSGAHEASGLKINAYVTQNYAFRRKNQMKSH